MQINIPDDPSQIKPIFEELKQNFYKGQVQKVEFREKSLAKLIAGYGEMKS